MSAKRKSNISDIVKLAVDEIPERRYFFPHARHFKASDKLMVDLWYFGLKISRATLRYTTQRGVRSDILPLGRRYRADRVFIMRRLNAHFASETFFWTLNH